MGHPVRLAARLGLFDLKREPTAFLCHVLALAAVLAPLLILYGLKHGVVSTMTRDLAADADIRQIVIKGVGEHPPALLEALRGDPLVGFVAPHPRPINADQIFAKAGLRGAPTLPGTVLGTGPGDPLLAAGMAAPGPDEALLSAGLARDLGVGAGDGVLVIAERSLDGPETAAVPLRVIGVLDAAAWSTQGALLHPETLIALDRWSEGYRVPALGETGRPAPPGGFTYATFRLFAANLDAVAPLAATLTEAGLNVGTKANRIATLQAFDRSLGVVFGIIAAVAGAGYLFSFGANLWANVARKSHELSVLRLQGLSRRATIAFPGAQAIVIAAAGWAVATLFYLAAAALINGALGDGLMVAGEVCRLETEHHLLAAAASLAVALLAAAVAAHRVTAIDPAEGMRHV